MILPNKNLHFQGFYLYVFSLTLIFSILVYGSIDQDEDIQKLEKAREYYQSAYFDQAIELLDDLTTRSEVDHEVQKEALRFISRAYTAKGLYSQAKEAIKKLLELEPPLVEFNPDREPPPLMKVYYEARKSVMGSYEAERPDPGMKTMAVIDFKNRSIDQRERFDPMQKGFADLIIHRLNAATNLKVIERERIQWILKEIEIQDEYSMDGAVRMGKQLGVHTVLLGSFIIFEDEPWIGARLVKVETSEILLTDEIKGEIDNFFNLSEKLGKNIAAKIEVTIPDSATALGSETKSLDAIMSYSEGLTYLEKGDYKKALNKFREALKHDPKYEKAKNKAESIQPYVG
jgi:TolB-like protein